MRDNVESKISYLLIGLGIGSLIGILFALKSGEGREYAQNKIRELRERAKDLIEPRQNDSLSAAVEAGNVAYQREKSKAAATS
jgi:gas vesicle protein